MLECLIKQPAGIGDIFLCQKIAKKYVQEYHCEVIWPIYPHLLWLKNYIKYQGINFIDINSAFSKKDIFISYKQLYREDDFIFIPLHTADQVYPNELILDAKFKLVNMVISDWLDYFTFERDLQKEEYLFKDILKLKEDDEYILINKMYGTPPTQKFINIKPDTNKKLIEINLIENISVFDWCKVLEKASEIHFVDSCFSLILNKLNIFKNVHLYSRNLKPASPSYNQTRHLFNINTWTWIQL